MKNKNQLQQGDVLLKRLHVRVELKNKVKKDKRGIVLAEGEATGHYHAILDHEDAELYQEGDRMLLSVLETTEVKHQEHDPVTLEPGIYEIGIVQEFDYLQQMKRRVID